MSRSRELWLLGAIIALAAFLRLWMLPSTPPGLWQDEAMNGNNAVEALATGPPAGGFKVFYPENFGREGLFINIQAFFLWLIGRHEPWTLRLPSALFGILTVLGIYFLTKELFREHSKKEWLALLAAFLLAISFWHLNFSRIGFRAIMAPFFLAWGMYTLLFAFNRAKQYSNILKNVGISAATVALTGGVVYGLGFHSYIAYRATPLLFLVLLPYCRRERSFWIIPLLFAIGALIAAAPLGLYFLEHPQDFFGRTAAISIFSEPNPLQALFLNIAKTVGMFFVVGDFNPRHNIPGAPLLFLPVAILFAIGIVLALKRRGLSNWLLLSWLIVAAAPVVISNEGIPHALRSILMVPPVFIISAMGGMWAWERLTMRLSPITSKTILVLFLITLIAQAYYAYFVLWARDPRLEAAFNVRDVRTARIINALPPEVPKYVGAPLHDVIRMQTIYFLTDTYLPERRAAKNIFFIKSD